MKMKKDDEDGKGCGGNKCRRKIMSRGSKFKSRRRIHLLVRAAKTRFVDYCGDEKEQLGWDVNKEGAIEPDFSSLHDHLHAGADGIGDGGCSIS
jgi:hypothetical protein